MERPDGPDVPDGSALGASLPPDLARDVELVRSLPVARTVLEACRRATGMGFAAIARITRTHWVACDVDDGLDFGLVPGSVLPVHATLCSEVVATGREVVVEGVATDPVRADHPWLATHGFASHVAIPIRLPGGRLFGTLCASDPEPRTLDEDAVLVTMRLFADLIGLHVDARERLTSTEAELADERRLTELREQFIAVLGHDLRNPLGSISANAQLIEALTAEAEVLQASASIARSVARMAELIGNLLDFARGRLGDGIRLETSVCESLGIELEAVVRELAVTRPDRRLECRFDIPVPVTCDPARVGQLLSNLVGNAFAHGDPATPVEVDGRVDGDRLRLSVANAGEPIAEDVRARLFQPMLRPADGDGQRTGRAGAGSTEGGSLAGLGLGLHIAREIALAHGGDIDVASDATRTVFAFTMATAGPADGATAPDRSPGRAPDGAPVQASTYSAISTRLPSGPRT